MEYRYENPGRCKVCKDDIVHKLSPGEDAPATVYYCSIACKNKDYRCKICGKDLWGDDPADDPPVSEFCGNYCHIFYLEAMIMRLETRIDNHIKDEQPK